MTPQEFLNSQPKSRPPISDPPTVGEGADGLLARASSDSNNTTSGPSMGTCGKWCWGVELENKNVSCTDICVSKDVGGPVVKVFVTGHGKYKFLSALVQNKGSHWRSQILVSKIFYSNIL